jgi:hypothetical protein
MKKYMHHPDYTLYNTIKEVCEGYVERMDSVRAHSRLQKKNPENVHRRVLSMK